MIPPDSEYRATPPATVQDALEKPTVVTPSNEKSELDQAKNLDGLLHIKTNEEVLRDVGATAALGLAYAIGTLALLGFPVVIAGINYPSPQDARAFDLAIKVAGATAFGSTVIPALIALRNDVIFNRHNRIIRLAIGIDTTDVSDPS